MAEKQHQFSIRLPKTIHEDLIKRAGREDRTVAAIIRRAMLVYCTLPVEVTDRTLSRRDEIRRIHG